MGKKEITIIGIGASAGGLEALQVFIANLPLESSMAYIIAQHLSPTYKSLMVELLQKGTNLKVLEASDGTNVEANTVYICPPNENIFLDGDTISLSKPKMNWHGPKPSIDLFFESLSESKKDKSIGIILSGTGSDGSRGIRAIKAAAGFTIVQEPKSAKYDGMPNSAILTGAIDLILQAEDIGSELQEMLNYAGKIVLKKPASTSTNIYKNILSKLKENKGVDFNQYKPSTIERRIERRMVALKIIKISDYYSHIVQNIDEIELLFKDILIGVTTFFRDGDSFYILKDHILTYLKNKKDKNIRVWAPGCSTGEEAYSLAIILSEILGADIGTYKIQIFATDINEDSLSFARKGTYPESALLALDKKFQNRYFTVKNGHYEVNKSIRSMVIFSCHDILKDPAFLRLDLIVCRNLLIYFSQALQKKLFPEFHYALNDEALMFLGKSESVGHFQSYFKTIDKKWKIYKANFIGTKERRNNPPAYQENDLKNTTRSISVTKKPKIYDIVMEHIDEFILPMCVVINENMDIVYVKGHNPYLIRPNGEQTQNIFKNINSDLSIELRASIHESSKHNKIFKSNFQKVILLEEVVKYVRISVVPLGKQKTDVLYLLSFEEEDIETFKYFTRSDVNYDNPANEKLEDELKKAKDYLQTVIEELETSNEEMQSLNEELQSSNEELQSSNEELETTNEELQAINEELQTAYSELRAVYEEREISAKELLEINKKHKQINKRLEAAVQCSELGIFDHHIPIREKDTWDEKWADIFGCTLGELPSDKSNMPEWITDHIHKDDREYFNEKYNEFLSGKIESHKVRFRIEHKKDGFRWVEHFAIAHSRNIKGKVSHSIGTLKDVSSEISEHINLEVAVEKLSNAQKIASLGNWEWDMQTNELSWSDEIYNIFGQDKKSLEINYNVFLELIYKEDREYVKDSISQAVSLKNKYDIIHRIVHPKNGIIHVREIGSIIFDNNQLPIKMIGTVQDITKIIENKQALIDSEEKLLIATKSAKIGLWERKSYSGEAYWDKKSYEIFGVDENTKITEALWNKLVNPNDIKMMKEEFSLAISEKRPYSYLFRATKPNGEKILVQGIGSPMYKEDGSFDVIIGTNIDVTEHILKNK